MKAATNWTVLLVCALAALAWVAVLVATALRNTT